MLSKTLCEMLDNYNERDKILRLMCYTSQLVSGLTNCDRLSRFSDILSDCRTTLRLLDDIPMLAYTMSYGLGKKEPDMYMQFCGVLVNVLDQLYYPFEHIAWAADKGLLTFPGGRGSEPWWTASNVCWAFSLYFNIAKSLRHLTLLHAHSKHLNLSDSFMREEFKKNSRLQVVELLTGVRSACDLVQAIHWMPEGFLWSGALSPWHIGALGTTSSVISLVQTCLFKDIS